MNNNYFIIVNSLDEEPYKSFYYSIENPSELLSEGFSIEEIRELSKYNSVTLFLPTEKFSIHYVELPELKTSKALSVLPFALEDKLADDISLLHFSFSYSQGYYQVAVCNKQYFQTVIDTFSGDECNIHKITLDWCALDINETWVTNKGLLVNQEKGFNGFVAANGTNLYLAKASQELPILAFSDSLAELYPTASQTLNIPYTNLAIQRIAAKQKTLNLLQGEFLPVKGNSSNSWIKATGVLVVLSIITWVIFSAYKLHYLKQEINKTDQQIAIIYHQYFPDAKQIISPRFRIEQHLKNQQSAGGDNLFWGLLNGLSSAFMQNQLTIKRLNFQNNNLQVTLITDNFNTLQSFQTALTNRQIQVKQLQASSEADKVLSVLELSLAKLK